MINIAVLGHGVVGSGVVEILMKNSESITKRANKEINVKYILDLREFNDLSYKDKFTKDFSEIEKDDGVKIVVECLGGINPSYDFVKRCLESGKSVVTSNKELVAEKGAELLKIAQDNNLNFLFEASVGGGIPIIRPLSQCLAANEVYEIAGILNGTTNFILTKMIREQMDFNTALKIAQELGYAEKDPTDDIEGNDACRKICILASLAFDYHVYPSEVHTEGITKITLEDVEYAQNWGGVIKLIGRVKKLPDGRIYIMVSPAFVPKSSQLANIDDVFNGILVRGDAIGDAVFYGKGAGKLPTASAVVADVIDCVKHINSRKYLFWEESIDNYVIDYKEEELKMFIRLKAVSEDYIINKITESFQNFKILNRDGENENELAIITPLMKEKEIDLKIEELVNNNIEILGKIRITDY